MSEEDFPMRAEPKIAGASSADAAAEAEQLLHRLVAATPDSEAQLKRILETLQSQTNSLVAERNQIRAERDALESRLSQGRVGRFLLVGVLLVALAISASGLFYVISYLGDADGVIAQLQSDVARLTGRSEPVTTGGLTSDSGGGLLAPPPATLSEKTEEPVRLGGPAVSVDPDDIERAVEQSPILRSLSVQVESLRAGLDQAVAAATGARDETQRLTGEFSVWRITQEQAVGQLDQQGASIEAVNNRLDVIVQETGELSATLAAITDEVSSFGQRLQELERKDAVRRARTPTTPKPIPQAAPTSAAPKIREVYVTGENDTLLSISRKFGVSVNRLLEVNGGGTLDDADRRLAENIQVVIPE